MICSSLAAVLLRATYGQLPPNSSNTPNGIGAATAPKTDSKYLIDSVAYLCARNPAISVRLFQVVQLTDDSAGMLLLAEEEKVLTCNIDRILDSGNALRHRSTKLRNHKEAIALAKAMKEFGITMPMRLARIPDSKFWRYHVRFYYGTRVTDAVWAVRKSDLKLYRSMSLW